MNTGNEIFNIDKGNFTLHNTGPISVSGINALVTGEIPKSSKITDFYSS